MPLKKPSLIKYFAWAWYNIPPMFKNSTVADRNGQTRCEVVVDFYCVNGWWTKVQAKYIFGPITKNGAMKNCCVLSIKMWTGWLLPPHSSTRSVLANWSTGLFPSAILKGTLPQGLSNKKKRIKEWCVLDTFDMFSPQYDQPQKNFHC